MVNCEASEKGQFLPYKTLWESIYLNISLKCARKKKAKWKESY